MERVAEFLKNEYICGAAKQKNDFYEISFLLLQKLDSDFVYRAYFLESFSTNLISMGVIETNDENGFLKIKCDYGKDTIVIMKKNTKTDGLTFITAAFFENEWNVKGYLDGSDNAIRLGKTICDINLSLKKYEKNENGFYKITDFTAIGNLSSVKCVLFERSVNYAFDYNGYYLFAIENNIITIGICPKGNENPFHHLNDFAYEKDGGYFVKIALEDDGQYFLVS